MAKVLLWVPGWNSQYSHKHVKERLNIDVVVVSVRNCSYELHERDYYYREYHRDITEICDDIDNTIISLPKKYKTVILYGHSRGGLASLLYCTFGKHRSMISALLLNDPMVNIGKYTAFVPLFMNIYPLCWNLTFPYVTLRSKVDVCRSFGRNNEEFQTIARILSILEYKTRQTGTFSDQIVGFLWWFKWMRETKLRMQIPTYVILAKDDSTIETTGAYNILNKFCSKITIEMCSFCTHDVLQFDGVLVNQILSRMKEFIDNVTLIKRTNDTTIEISRPHKEYVLWLPTCILYILLGYGIYYNI